MGAMQRYQHSPANTIVQRWQTHVNGWLDAIDASDGKSMLAIEYSDLDLHFDRTLAQLSAFLQLPLSSSLVRPSRFQNVIEVTTPAEYKPAHSSDEEAKHLIENLAGDTLKRLATRRTRYISAQ